MRVLHTSDWHIGRTFHGRDLLADQEQVLDAVAALVRERAVDVVVVAGDLYDRAVPSAAAVQLATRAISRLRDAGARIVVTSGNHDSAPRLGAFADVLALGGLHLCTNASRLADPILIDDHEGTVALYGIPYLEPDVVRSALGVTGRAGHQEVMAAAMDLIARDLATRPAGTRSVVAAHAFVVGGQPSGSERSIAVGGVESVSASVFDGIDYVALGHLHGRQRITERVRYSGSLLPYSFSEAGHRKGVWIVDIDAAGSVRADWAELPVIRPLARLRGTLAEILSGRLDYRDHYLSVELTDPVRPLDPMRALQEKLPYTVTLSWQPPAAMAAESPYPSVGSGATDSELVDSFLHTCRGSGATDAERGVIDAALAAMRAGEVTA